MSDIAGKVALVTGASSGLGLRFAEILAAEGARVALAARRTDRLEAAAARMPGAITLRLDVADIASIRAAAAEVAERLGPIDILVNNAGISRMARVEDVEEAEYDAVLDTNLKGAFFMAQAAGRQMIAAARGGRIVNIASVAGLRTLGHLGTYAISKAGVVHMTRAMAREWGRHGINVNAICPGYIATEISADFLGTEAGDRLVRGLPRRRMGEARDLDALLLLLCSGEASRFINGAVMVADDGLMAM